MSNPAFKFDDVHIINQDPEAAANWYVETFGARIAANTLARGAPQIFVDLRNDDPYSRPPAGRGPCAIKARQDGAALARLLP